MSVEVTRVAGDDWNRHVERSPEATPFHRLEALELFADHAGAELHLLVGRKGQEPVGVFPVFVRDRFGVATAFSPPPALRVPYLGPATLNMAKLKPRKAQRRNARFVDGCLDYLDDLRARYCHVRTGVGYEDLRPFQWRDYDVSVGYTYLVDLTPDEEDLLASFSSDARRNVRDADEHPVVEGDAGDVRRIMDTVRSRYAEQGKQFGLPTELAVDLYHALPAGTVRPYVFAADDAPTGGILTLTDDATVYRWQGGVKRADGPDSDLLDWAVMTAARERGVDTYDLVGADNRRITDYKSKFAPALASYRTAEWGTPLLRLAAAGYKRLNK